MSSFITGILTSSNWSELDTRKLEEIGTVCTQFQMPLTNTYILINIVTQRLHLIASQELANSYLVSTAQKGVGQKEGTGQTPLGLHFVEEKIGDGADPFAVFRSRKLTGEFAEADQGGKEPMIVGRILWLQGAQPGFNQGHDSDGNCVDTYNRYIYIHGTDDIANLGKPASSGCIRMDPVEVVNLFGKVSEKTPVYIYQA